MWSIIRSFTEKKYAQLFIWPVLKFWQFPILTNSNSDKFQFWQIPILTISNSDNFQFCQIPILTNSYYDNFQFWQIDFSDRRRTGISILTSAADNFKVHIRYKKDDDGVSIWDLILPLSFNHNLMEALSPTIFSGPHQENQAKNHQEQESAIKPIHCSAPALFGHLMKMYWST